MDRILILALLIGLASAQINFSTSWGKRSSPTSSATGPALQPIQYQQQHHSSSRKESLGTIQPILSEYPEMSEEQRATILPSPCLSLLKSLLLVNQIVENEMLRMDKYGRQQDAIQSTGILNLSDP